MARPTLGTHPKFHRLSAMLGGRAVARGSLELIWDCAYASGDPVIGDSMTLEASADWRGDPGKLTDALVASGFVDVVQTDANGGQLQTFAVHDLEHHAPDYVLKRWEREAKRRENGDTIRTVRQRAAGERWTRRAMQVSAVVTPPAPAPAPRSDPPIAPLTGSTHPGESPPGPAAPADGGGLPEPKYPRAFEEVWERTGRVGNKFKGWEAWKKAKSPPWAALQASWASYLRSADPVRGYVQHLSTWLNKKGWAQDWPPAGPKGSKPARPPEPSAPAPRAPRCSHHEKNDRFRNPHPVDWCPGCREQVSREGTRTMTAEELLEPPDWMAIGKAGAT